MVDHVPRATADVEHVELAGFACAVSRAALDRGVEQIYQSPGARGKPPMLVFGQFFNRRRRRLGNRCDGQDSSKWASRILHAFKRARNVWERACGAIAIGKNFIYTVPGFADTKERFNL